MDDGGKLFFDILSKVLILRILRLTRLVRALRMFEQFQEMWKLANGLVRSLRTVISACLMIFITVYVLACLGIELIARNSFLTEDPDTAQVIQENFQSLPMTMATLIQFANADSIVSVYKPIVERVWYLGFYFALVWLVITIKLMNLITAVIVDNAITQGDADREMERDKKRRRLRHLQPQIEQIFLDLLEEEFVIDIDMSTGLDLGVQWDSESSLSLRIIAVTPDGLVQQWNETNWTNAYPQREVKLGSRIVAVNGRRGVNQMTAELDRKGQVQLSVKAGTGKLSKNDFRDRLQNVLADRDRTMEPDRKIDRDLRKILHTDRLVEICDYLDSDRSGDIDQEEFIDGVFSLMLQSVPLETTQMLQLLRSNNEKLQRIQRDVASPALRQTDGRVSETDVASANFSI
jgi:hypothetical protein